MPQHDLDTTFAAPDARTGNHTTMWPATACPYCGDSLLAPEHSEFHGGGRIEHVWCCESCGAATTTTVAIAVTTH